MTPARQTRGSAGADLSIEKDVWLWPFQTKLVMTSYKYDVAGETWASLHTDVRPRSSVSKRGILVHLGLIDSDYAGNNVGVILSNLTPFPKKVKAGRVAQLVVAENYTATFFPCKDIARTTGFGSTGV